MAWTDTAIDVVIPNLAPGNYDVQVHTPAGVSTPIQITVLAPSAPPELDTVTPSSGVPGTILKLEGSNFGGGSPGSVVTIGGTIAQLVTV